jgi:hypothetical protein
MTEKENRKFEEKVAEHQRQVEEKGYAERGNERFYEFETPCGKVWFITVLAQQERHFRNMVIIHKVLSTNIDIDTTYLDEFLADPSSGEKLDEWVMENCVRKDIESINKMTAKAINYFADNLREMFAVNLLNYVDETFFYALIKTVGEDDPNPPKTESAIFTHFAEFAKSRLKNRLNIRKTSGRKSKRKGEELLEMLSSYNSLLPLIQAAKKDYTLKKRERGWVKSIKELHPHLPISIIERFDQQGVTPGELALIVVAEKFNAEPTEALRKKIMETRKANEGR